MRFEEVKLEAILAKGKMTDGSSKLRIHRQIAPWLLKHEFWPFVETAAVDDIPFRFIGKGFVVRDVKAQPANLNEAVNCMRS